ncbi:molecular chaperone [Enterobacter sp. Ap-1006]|uniref:fimbrial biogenesis chaperone n=1 Tax=Enterobacter sp. Ap-1006 TaxID=2608345 RepID=UPI00141FCC8B|nr:molecular chaperone [Enterobacter sp. Ap-1006]NIF47407.1 molecular chaperone [Enterobacter sp. Ap-1006]
MKISHTFSCLLVLFALLQPSLASAEPGHSGKGLTYYVTRVVYPAAEKKGVTLTAHNKTSRSWLVQSFIRPVDPATGSIDIHNARQINAPFIVTPPLERLEANGELTVRIRRNAEPLPQDRESVFFIAMKAIPAEKTDAKQQSENKVVLAVVNSIKVFYRPEGLEKYAIEDVAGKLSFTRRGDALIAKNPTPYWLTFARLSVGKNTLDKAQLRLMVPPKGEQTYRFPQGAAGQIEWQLIDEDGWHTEPLKQD